MRRLREARAARRANQLPKAQAQAGKVVHSVRIYEVTNWYANRFGQRPETKPEAPKVTIPDNPPAEPEPTEPATPPPTPEHPEEA